jgi:hypothetical protein
MPAAGAFRPWKPPDQSPLTYGSVKDLGAVRLQARDFTDGVSRLCSREPFSRRSAANPHKRPKDSHAEQNLLRYQKRAQDAAIIECIVRALAIGFSSCQDCAVTAKNTIKTKCGRIKMRQTKPP